MAQPDGVTPRPAQTAFGQDTLAEDQRRSGNLETIGLIEAPRSNLVTSRPTQSALFEDAKVEDRSEPARLETIGLVESRCSNLINSRHTQTALEQEITVEDTCKSAWLSQLLELQSSHFIGFDGTTSDTAPMEAGIEEESILDALDSGFNDMVVDNTPFDEEEYQAMIKEYEAELAMEETAESDPTEQEVLMAGRGHP